MQASSERPRFRQDLVAEPIEDGASRFIDVMDPDSGNLFRFYEVEYALACAMDGERDVGGIVKWAKDELGLTASANEVQTVIATLGELGYLESGAAAAAAAKPETAAPEPPRPAAARAPQPAYNRWDQPTAMGSYDDYMEAQAAAKGDVELGHAGTSRAAASSELPKAPDLELGAPGASAVPVREALPKADDLSLGASGRSQVSEVSLDLSKHLEVKRDDVKEAVRASQVMQAVEVPPELAAEAEGKAKPAGKEAAKPAAKEAAKAEAKPAKTAEAKTAKEAAKGAEAKTADAKPAKAAEAKPAKEAAKADTKPTKEAAKGAEAKTDAKPAKEAAKADTKPAKETAKAADAKAEAKPAKETAKADPKAKPPVEQPRPVAPPAPRTGTSPVLILLLVLVILAAGGFAVWKFVLNKPAQEASTQAPPPAPVAPPTPAPPPPETAKLETDQPPAVDLKAPSAGVVEKIVAGDTAVKAGDVVAWLVGEKPHDTQVKAVQADIEKRLKPELEKAEKEVDAGVLGGKKPSPAAQLRVTKSQKALDDKTAELAKLQAELDKFLVKAPADGTVAVVAKAQQKITPNDVVAKLTPPAHLVATFKKAGTLEVGQHVWLALTGGDQKLACTVVEASPDQSKIACPHDAATEGAEVTFAGADTSTPADQGSAAAAGSAEGSAATPGVEMDQGSAAGSAAAPAAATAPAPAAAPAPPPVHHVISRPHHHAHPTAPAAGSGEAAAPADKPADVTAAPAATPAPAPAADSGGSAASH